jgi:hypothetical protein
MSSSRKRKAKKRAYKPVFKGVRYVAKVLVKYGGKEYSSYGKALPKAREVYAELVASGEKVRVGSVMGKVRVKRGSVPKKGEVPQLPLNLQRTAYFFELQDYPRWIKMTTDKIWFKSKLWRSELGVVQGGTFPEYRDYFAAFVNYCNKQMAKADKEGDTGRYANEWLVKCDTVRWNPATKRFECEIISVDGDGQENDYGFSADLPQDGGSGGGNTPKRDKKATTGQEKGQSGKDSGADLEVEKEKTKRAELEAKKAEVELETAKVRQQGAYAKAISDIAFMLKQGVITKAQAKKMIAKLNG